MMLAIKAKYDNGVVRWLENPPVTGTHDLIVLFEDVTNSLSQSGLSIPSGNNQASEDVLQPLPELIGSVPDNWKEAIYGG